MKKILLSIIFTLALMSCDSNTQQINSNPTETILSSELVKGNVGEIKEINVDTKQKYEVSLSNLDIIDYKINNNNISITFKKEGTTTLFVIADNTQYKCEVKCYDLKTYGESCGLVNQEIQLTANKENGVWSSENNNILSIDENGLVNTKSIGETNIIYKYDDVIVKHKLAVIGITENLCLTMTSSYL